MTAMSFLEENLSWLVLGGATASASVALLVACGSEEVGTDLAGRPAPGG